MGKSIFYKKDIVADGSPSSFHLTNATSGERDEAVITRAICNFIGVRINVLLLTNDNASFCQLKKYYILQYLHDGTIIGQCYFFFLVVIQQYARSRQPRVFMHFRRNIDYKYIADPKGKFVKSKKFSSKYMKNVTWIPRAELPFLSNRDGIWEGGAWMLLNACTRTHEPEKSRQF